MPVSEVVRSAAEEHAERVLTEHETQRVPAEFSRAMLEEAMLDAPDTEPHPNPALTAAAQRARTLRQR